MSTSSDAAPDPRARVVARNTVWLTLDAGVSIVASFALSVMVARALGPDVLGIYSYAMWLIAVATAVATTGVASGMQQFAAERLGRGDPRGARAVLRWGLPWQLGLAAVLVALGIGLTLAFSPAAFRVPLLIAVVSVAPALLVSVPSAGLGAAQAYGDNVLPSIIAVIVNVTVAAVSLVAGFSLLGLTTALLLSRCVDLALRCVAWRRVWKGLAATAAGATPTMPLGEVDLARMRRYAWRSSVLLLIDMIVWDRSEYFVLMHFSPAREIAFYALSFNIVQQALMLPKMLAWGLNANMLVERGRDPQGAVRISRDAIRYVFLLATPVMVGLAAIDRAIMPVLYGRRYDEAIPVLTVVAGLAVLRGALVPVQALLRMSEEQAFLIRFGLVMSVVSIGLDLLLIPSGGALGAAWANGLAQATAAFGLTVFAARRLGLSVPVGDMVRILVASVPMAIAARFICDSIHHWPAVFVSVPLGALLYAIALRWLGVLGAQDRTRLASLDRLLPFALRPAYLSVLAWLAVGRAAS